MQCTNLKISKLITVALRSRGTAENYCTATITSFAPNFEVIFSFFHLLLSRPDSPMKTNKGFTVLETSKFKVLSQNPDEEGVTTDGKIRKEKDQAVKVAVDLRKGNCSSSTDPASVRLELETSVAVVAAENEALPDVEHESIQQGKQPDTTKPQTALTSIDKQLLILCSNQSFDRQVIENQERAYVALKAAGIDYQTIDGADPACKVHRNELFSISGLRAKYPQFFLVDGRTTVFWGVWDRFLESMENTRLGDEFGLNPASVVDRKPYTTSEQPAISNTFRGRKRMLVLCSSQSLKREVSTTQDRMYTILRSKKIDFDTIDGADPCCRERRNELFALSGKRGVYPQLFITDEEKIAYWGEWERLMEANESGTLLEEVSRPGVALLPSEPTQMGSDEGSKRSLLVLCSMQSFDSQVKANQNRTFDILKLHSIPYTIIDGSDIDKREKRNELFALSGRRAQYPQFFLSEMGSEKFWGDFNELAKVNDAGTLKTVLNVSAVEKPGGAVPISSDSFPPSVTEKASQKIGIRASMATRGLPPLAPTKDDASIKKRSKVGFEREIMSDITVYGATGHVGKRSISYLMQSSLSVNQVLRITIAGRTKKKLDALQKEFSTKMGHLTDIEPNSKGKCVFDVVAADSSDADAIMKMASRTKVVISCAGPFSECGSNIVAACASTGADYVDITGEVSWAGEMRTKYGKAAAESGSRIVSFCGFDSVPSDLAVLAAVHGLRQRDIHCDIETATTWHHCFGAANGGTIRTAAKMPLNVKKCFLRWVPFLMDDPLILTHPRIRLDPAVEETRNRLAMSEWMNQMPKCHTIFKLGVSAPFLMAPVNTKVVNASAIALQYGPNFVYEERFLPSGFKMTTRLGLLSIIPALIAQLGVVAATVLMKTPILGSLLISVFAPPGMGMTEDQCRHGHGEVYAEVCGAVDKSTGLVEKANSHLEFTGDPANWITAQCVSESALSLLLNRNKLPPRSPDGFGTPAELIGMVLLDRMMKSTVRPLKAYVSVRKATAKNEWRMFP